jgi:hypothetical protein
MYYPEANVLLPRSVDPDSLTPAFKGGVVSIIAPTVAVPVSQAPTHLEQT